MANTVTRGGSFLTLSGIDTDVLAEDLWPEQAVSGIPILSIDFVPAAQTDKCVIREGSLTGPIIFQVDTDIAGQATWTSTPNVKNFQGKPIKPCIDVSDGTYNAAALVIFHIGNL